METFIYVINILTLVLICIAGLLIGFIIAGVLEAEPDTDSTQRM